MHDPCSMKLALVKGGPLGCAIYSLAMLIVLVFGRLGVFERTG